MWTVKLGSHPGFLFKKHLRSAIPFKKGTRAGGSTEVVLRVTSKGHRESQGPCIYLHAKQCDLHVFAYLHVLCISLG